MLHLESFARFAPHGAFTLGRPAKAFAPCSAASSLSSFRLGDCIGIRKVFTRLPEAIQTQWSARDMEAPCKSQRPARALHMSSTAALIMPGLRMDQDGQPHLVTCHHAWLKWHIFQRLHKLNGRQLMCRLQTPANALRYHQQQVWSCLVLKQRGFDIQTW